MLFYEEGANWPQTVMEMAEKCEGALNEAFARKFAGEWIAAWNSHDLNRILEHYTDDFEMRSPIIIERVGEASGTLRGKARVGAYWEAALKADPPVKFELIGVYAGIKSVTLHYRSVGRRMATEVLEFNSNYQVVRGSAHYGEPA
jgi:hypothetical protein